jgi:hypothetical protein
LSPGIGFGGFCFPKDLAAFITISSKLGYNFELLRATEKVNEDQKRFFVEKIENAVWNIKSKTIGVLGLAVRLDNERAALLHGVAVVNVNPLLADRVVQAAHELLAVDARGFITVVLKHPGLHLEALQSLPISFQGNARKSLSGGYLVKGKKASPN